MATYVGEKEGGIIGAILTTISFVIPAIISMYFVHKLFDMFKENAKVVTNQYLYSSWYVVYN